MQKTQIKNSADEKITIEAELPVPLLELEIYLLPLKENDFHSVVEMLKTKPYIAESAIEKQVQKIIRTKKSKVVLDKLKFWYMDSHRISHGTAYFQVYLTGKKDALKRIAGPNRFCYFDWEKPLTA